MPTQDIFSHPKLCKLLQQAYSAERAASFAYQGHAGAVKNIKEKKAIKQIENDEWQHRAEVLKIMNAHNIPVSKYYEIKYFVVGKIISGSSTALVYSKSLYLSQVFEGFILKIENFDK